MTEKVEWKHETGDTQSIRNHILTTFLQAGSAFVSGGTLADALQVTRTSVWKHIRALEQQGFRFESVHGTGYRLVDQPDVVMEPLLRPLLAKKFELGQHVHWFSQVDSTNAVAMKLALAGAPHGTLVTALQQTGGHGRRGKAWFSPVGGLWLTIVLQKPFPLRNAPELTLLASIALRRALANVMQVSTRIKWPNDLLLNGKKISGILAEIRADGELVQHAVVGIGINTNLAGHVFPHDLRERATSIMQEIGGDVSHLKLTAALLQEFHVLFENLLAGDGFATVSDEWREASFTLGTEIQVQTPNGLVCGKAEQIDDQGVLFVRQSNGVRVMIHSGEILF